MTHLLVTNDFPPKVGGIQSYLWELWRRLPPEEFSVMTTPYEGAAEWDAQQPFSVARTRERVLLPTRGLVRRVEERAEAIGADLVLLDPALPLGLIGPELHRPYGVVLHGAEITVPGRLPLTRHLLARVLRRARFVVAAGPYPLTEAERALGSPLDAVVVPPGVDTDRFSPLGDEERCVARRRLGLPEQGKVVVSVSRLVPRKGMDVLIRAAAALRQELPDLLVAIAGAGRDRRRLEHLIRSSGSPALLLGRVPDAALPDLYACGEVFAMLCRDRWMGLEQEGFGIVFLEAAAAGVPQLAGSSGGAADAVHDGITGVVASDPRSVDEVTRALRSLLLDEGLRARLGAESRLRAVESFSYPVLAEKLHAGLARMATGIGESHRGSDGEHQ